MKTNYILIDYENVQTKSLALLKGEQFRVRIFLGPNNTKLPVELVLAMHELGERADYVILETPGVNALDFHIAYYLGILAANDPSGFFHIVSKDTGFDPLIKHMKANKIFAVRSISIEEMPCLTPPATKGGAIAINQKNSSTRTSIDELIEITVEDLLKRNTSKPRTPKTLMSTIHAKFGKNTLAVDIEAVYKGLMSRGYVKVNGTKVSYELPATT
ncbi:MAG: PIN domain-containing protein [Nitrosomonas sp.]|uniref:PIN domain-containing protein n=1 Tax=Nitrosomonas sp. TaxID=42353 RepID=UPI002734E9C8|nr:PIN domain-containing protein [Nitrosomonas sp.]MDP3281736.1 PIN domain-containing protein [Nitrosomonas sp.]